MTTDDTTTDTASPTPLRSATGRPILGAIAGFFLGLFLWLDLVLFGVIAFDSVTIWIFPILGVIAGIALARWAPLRRSASAAQPSASITSDGA